MKKIALYILAAAAVLVGCSKNNADTTPVQNGEDAWMTDLSLPVPIRFSAANSSLTKGAINTVNDMVGKKFGFFAVNGYNEHMAHATGLDMPQNAEATCHIVDANKVRFEFTDGNYYYPQTVHDPYTFYGYHAHLMQSENGQYYMLEKDSIAVRLNIGHTDILWGKAKATPETVDGVEYVGFNAPYIRKTGKQPFMNFKHVTSCISFNAKTKIPEYAATENDADNVVVTGVRVLGTVTSAELCIAHRTRDELEGTFIRSIVPNGNVSVTKDDAGTNPNLDVTLTTSSQPLGADIFLCPSEEIKVEISYKSVPKTGVAGTNNVFKSTYTLRPTVEGGSTVDGFVAGYHYKYTFVVYSPEKIVIEAKVVPYESAFGKDDAGDDIYKEVLPENE